MLRDEVKQVEDIARTVFSEEIKKALEALELKLESKFKRLKADPGVAEATETFYKPKY